MPMKLFSAVCVQVLLLLSAVNATSLRRSSNNSNEDTLAAFKNKNLLKDSLNLNPVQLSLEDPKVSFGGSGPIRVSKNSLEALPSPFTANAQYFQDGVQQALPPNGLYTSPQDSNVWVVLNPETNTMEKALHMDPDSGKTTALLPMDLDLQVFTQVETTDVDPKKLARFHFSEEDHPSSRTRSLQELLQEDSRQQSFQFDKPNDPPPCQDYKIIRVAIAYESRFCEVMGGRNRADQVVQLTVAQSSLKFQRPGLCIKLQLSHLEGYCDPQSDPYHNMFSGSVCKTNDQSSILKLFRNYWKANRAPIQRDVAHLFHGFNHASGTVGCAWAASLCDQDYGYGVNEITFGGNNNPTFWTILFAHELGHSAGAPHEQPFSQTLMDPSTCLECDEFSDTSVAYIRLHMADVHPCLQDESATIAGEPPSTGGDTTTALVDTDNTNSGGWADDGACSNRLQYCNLGPCCEPMVCYNRFICL